MIEDQQRPRYWLITAFIMSAVAALAVASAVLIPLFTPTLNLNNLLGFPLGFYFAAQGIVIVLIVIVNWAGGRQAEIDRKFGAIEDL